MSRWVLDKRMNRWMFGGWMNGWMLGGWMNDWMLGGWMQRKKRNVTEVNNQPMPPRQQYIPTLNTF